MKFKIRSKKDFITKPYNQSDFQITHDERFRLIIILFDFGLLFRINKSYKIIYK